MPLRVFLHVGSPKTGTTFLQNVLWTQRALAREQGLLLPLRSFHDHFLATLDVRELTGQVATSGSNQGRGTASSGRPKPGRGNVFISHELFAGATQAQAEKAMARVRGGDRGPRRGDGTRPDEADTRGVAGARQASILSTISRDFLLAIKQDPDHDTWFWRVQDVPDVLDRWGHTLPRDRVHVVTVPPAGSDPTILWRRFAELVDLDADAFDLEQSRSNTSLGSGADRAVAPLQLRARQTDSARAPGTRASSRRCSHIRC